MEAITGSAEEFLACAEAKLTIQKGKALVRVNYLDRTAKNN
jgi:hypothetical protein